MKSCNQVIGLLLCLSGLVEGQEEIFSMRLGAAGVAESAPVIAEVDGDKSNGTEVVVATADGMVVAYSGSGAVLWQQTTPNFSCIKTGDANKVKSSPAIADLDGDAIPEVVLGYGGIDQGACGGGVVALRGDTGSTVWHFNVDAQPNSERLSAVFGTPGIADLNGDGTKEVCFGAHDRNIYCLDSRGRPIFLYHAADTVFSSPAFADLDGDGDLEVVMGTDISENQAMEIRDGGFVYALNVPTRVGVKQGRSPRNCKALNSKQQRRRCRKRNRRLKQQQAKNSQQSKPFTDQIEFDFRDSNAFLWKQAFDQTMQSSAVVADVISSRSGAELVVGSGCFFPQNSSDKRGKWIKVLSGRNGRVLASLTTDKCISSSPAVADLNGDGLLDVVVLQGGENPRVTAWTPETDSILWEFLMSDTGLGNHGRQALIADMDGNGSLEVLAGNRSSVRVLAGSSGELLGSVSISSGSITSTPAVGDLDGDGDLELVAAGRVITAWQDFSKLGSFAGPEAPYALPFGMWRGDAERSGSVKLGSGLVQ